VEHLICDNPEISRLDDELGTAYKIALVNKKRADFIREAQKQWLKDRDACVDLECLAKAYKDRIVVLAAFGDKDPLLPLKPPAAKIKSGQYKMIDDTIVVPQPNGISTVEKHAEVCTAFLKNLEAFPPFPPMACDVKFKPEFTDFKTPEWQEVDVWANRDLWIQLESAPPKGNTDKERMLSILRERINNGMVFFRVARFDIDNDGEPEQVLKKSTDKCEPEDRETHGSLLQNYPSYTIYDPVSRKVNIEKAAFYRRYWDHYISLFSYKGVTYYASLLADTTNDLYFGKLDRPDKHGIRPTKYYIKLFRPLTMEQGLRTTWKQPAALGCNYLYLPANNEGGY
jgi:hypothetical protein